MQREQLPKKCGILPFLSNTLIASSRPFSRLIRRIFDTFGYSVVRRELLIDYCLHKYRSYDEYKEVQIRHNKRKITRVWADDATLYRVIDIVLGLYGHSDTVEGLCHGSRNGFEQKFLNATCPKINAIGTDISETAAEFDHTIQWDFHDINPNWVAGFDFIYSNSLDQSWNPMLALTTWLNQVKTGGVVIIEHTESHGPLGASEMDPFGVKPTVFPYVLTQWFGHQITISHTKAKKSNKDIYAWLFVVKKLACTVNYLPDQAGFDSIHYVN
jgi:hypothetical protein